MERISSREPSCLPTPFVRVSKGSRARFDAKFSNATGARRTSIIEISPSQKQTPFRNPNLRNFRLFCFCVLSLDLQSPYTGVSRPPGPEALELLFLVVPIVILSQQVRHTMIFVGAPKWGFRPDRPVGEQKVYVERV